MPENEKKNCIEMVDKIQILTRAMNIAQVSREDHHGGIEYKKTASVEVVIANYKKLLATLTEG